VARLTGFGTGGSLKAFSNSADGYEKVHHVGAADVTEGSGGVGAQKDLEGASYQIPGPIPDARFRVYPDAVPGFVLRYPSEVAAETNVLRTASNEAAWSSPWKW
jgi:hypothetical protein